MCEKCVELDQKIENHKRLIGRLMDPPTNGAGRTSDRRSEKRKRLRFIGALELPPTSLSVLSSGAPVEADSGESAGPAGSYSGEPSRRGNPQKLR
jgi:hypothetical protein